MSAPLLSVENLHVRFPAPRRSLLSPRQHVHAVRGVSFDLAEGRTLGLVGESGSGKTTTAMAAIRLVEAQEGRSLLDGENLLALSAGAMRRRRRDVQVVFQDPYSSLNPRERVGAIVREPLDLMRPDMDRSARDRRVRELFALVGLRDDQLALFPHQFSGGQRQRVSIARALATNPRLVVCDEPVSALDVAIQAQILNLLRRLQDELGLAYLFISHDLGVVRHICDDVAVMYGGEIVERATRRALFAGPRHPYTAALVDAAPSLARRKSRGVVHAAVVDGDPPSPLEVPPGCVFASRCPRRQPLCTRERPVLVPENHAVACHFPLDGVPPGATTANAAIRSAPAA